VKTGDITTHFKAVCNAHFLVEPGNEFLVLVVFQYTLLHVVSETKQGSCFIPAVGYAYSIIAEDGVAENEILPVRICCIVGIIESTCIEICQLGIVQLFKTLGIGYINGFGNLLNTN
jgi:hypothetical protein